MTDILGLQPRKTSKLGEETILSSGTTVHAKTGTWSLRREAADNGFAPLLRGLIELCISHESALSAAGVETKRLSVFVSYDMEQANFELDLDPDLLKEIAKSGIEMRIIISHEGPPV